jgi:deoxyribodipyrimidine photolyase
VAARLQLRRPGCSPARAPWPLAGAYIKRWVPELAGLASEHIHAPWLAPAGALQAAGVTLGVTYPHRIAQ